MLVAVIGGAAVLLLSGGDDGDGGQGGGRPGEDQQASGQTPATMPGGGARPTIPDELPTIPEEGAGGPDGTLSEGVLPTVDPDANGNLPEDVVVDLYEALSAGDCAAIRAAMAESLFTNDGAMTEDESMAACERQPVQETRVENVQFAGFRPEPDPAEPRMLPNSAGVVGDVVTDGQTYEHVFFLILEDGLWRVYLT